MNKALIWKEFREQGVIAVALAVLGSAIVVAMLLLVPPPREGATLDNYAFNAGTAGTLAMILVAGLVIGGTLFAGEAENETKAFFDLLPVSRTAKWRGKWLAGLGLVVPIAVVLFAVGALGGFLGPVRTLGYAFLGTMLLAMTVYGWGMVGSALSRSSLNAAALGLGLGLFGCAVYLGIIYAGVFFFTIAMAGTNIPPLASEVLSVIIVAGVFFGLFLTPWFLSYWIYTRPDVKRRQQLIDGAMRLASGKPTAAVIAKPSLVNIRSKRVLPQFRAAVWMVRQQTSRTSKAAIGISFLLGFLFVAPGAPAVILWPVLSLIPALLVGVLVWFNEQTTGANRYWVERRFPTGALWLAKLAVSFGTVLASTIALSAPLFVLSLSSIARLRMNLDPPSVVMLLPGFQLVQFAVIWPLYGWACGFLVGLLLKKPLVSIAVGLLVAAISAAVWLPSFFVGGLHVWQWLIPVLLVLAVNRLLVWPFAAEQLSLNRYLARLAVGLGSIAAAIGVAVAIRAVELPDTPQRTADVTYAQQNIPAFDENLGGRDIRRAANALGAKLKVELQGRMNVLPTMAAYYNSGI